MRIVAGKTCMDRNAPKACATRPAPPTTTAARSSPLARARPADLRHHAALFAHLHARTAGGPGSALGRAPHLPHADASLRTDGRMRLGGRTLPRGARLPRHLRTRGPPRPRRGLRPRHPPLGPREGPPARDGRGARPLPHVQHLHRLGPLRHGRLAAAGHRIGLATDTGGGSSFSMLRTMAAAYEIAQLRGRALHPAELLWLATAGSARALRLDDRIGRLAPGMEADLVVLDLASTPAIAQRAPARATSGRRSSPRS
jgi:guanine deaminase